MKTCRVAVVLSAAVLSGVLASASLAQVEAPPLPAGTPAPAFVTKTLSGRPLSLRALRGRVVLLDYWATWCGPCQMATPTLQALHKKYASRGLSVVGISVDDATSVAHVKPFVRHFGMTYAVAAVPKADIQAAQAYHVQGIPSQYLIDRKGVVRWSQAGFSRREGKELSGLIEKLLAEKK